MAERDSNIPAGAGPSRAAEGADSLRQELTGSAGGVRRFLFALCRDWHQAEDLAQEALLKAWAGRGSFNGRSSVRTWVCAVARNLWLDQLRRKTLRPNDLPAADDLPGPAAGPADQAQQAELSAALAAALRSLPPEQHEALALRESGLLTFEEIAQVLGVPAATVKSRVRYGLMKLAEQLRAFA